MTQTPDKLDRIERVLDNLAAGQVSLREDLEILFQTVRLAGEQTDSAISRLNSAMTQLTEQVNQTNSRVDQLAVTMERFAQNAEADRTAIREMQAEIQIIWQYLLEQRPNGQQG